MRLSQTSYNLWDKLLNKDSVQLSACENYKKSIKLENVKAKLKKMEDNGDGSEMTFAEFKSKVNKGQFTSVDTFKKNINLRKLDNTSM